MIVRGGRPLRGTVRVPGDKSISHRALLLAALAEGTSVVRGLSTGDDVARTRAAVEALGASVDGEAVSGGRSRLHEPADVVDVGNSGTSIRLLAGLCATVPGVTVLTGDGSIRRRPMDRVAAPLREMGAHLDGRDGGRLPPLVVRGAALKGIDYRLPVPSAQVKAAVLLAGLAAEGETVVREDVRTRAHTEEMLALAGADVRVEDGGLTTRVRPSSLHPFRLDVPGDPSQAAFWLVGAAVVPGSDVTVEHVYLGPARAAFLDVLERMGADVERDRGAGAVRVRHRGPLSATEVGGDEIPALIDEIPVLAVAAACAEGTTVVRDAAELRVKESDRIAAVVAELGRLGAVVEPRPDGLAVTGPTALTGATVDSGGDHRMAMALAIAGLAATGQTVVEGWDAVATSYPGFAADLEALTCG
ncbi:MAG: 3-phosphoshikimate 1-carboxyvinyltransferase [Acidimicrobiia bacterium]